MTAGELELPAIAGGGSLVSALGQVERGSGAPNRILAGAVALPFEQDKGLLETSKGLAGHHTLARILRSLTGVYVQ